ncbi:MAG: winged helix-turn-helix domain-containing protein [Acidobacteriota bacterium]|nr:winged helix-turn-helix domain-containing protein [Acidobacteriota bacterium]
MTKSLKLYEFGEFRLDLERNLLLHQGKTVPLTHKALQTLTVLVENNGRTVEKDEIIRQVWQDTFVEEGSLTRNISTLRKVLGEDPASNKYIETIPRRGYRFVARVKEISDEDGEDISTNNFIKVRPAEEKYTRNSNENTIKHNDKEGNDLVKAKSVLPQNETQIKPSPTSQKIKLFLLLSLLIVTPVIIFFVLPKSSELNQTNVSFNIEQELSFTRLTNVGKAVDAAISPDGKYVVYVTDDIGKQTLWVKQVATGSSVQITDSAEVTYQGLSFSSDSNFVYFNLWDRKSVGAIHRIPTLGGVSTKIITDCMPTMAISPDGRKIAFVRGYAAQNEQALIIADSNGGSEQIISRSSQWRAYPAWSPDGNKIAFAVGVDPPQEQGYVSIREISIESLQEKEITSKRWLGFSGLVWFRDGRSLIVNGSEDIQQPFQLWKLDYLSGEVHKITNGANGYYGGISITADSSSMIATQEDAYVNIWTAPATDLNEISKITSGKYEGVFLSWTPDNKIVYSSRSNGNLDTWIMDQDGSNKRQLTDDKESDYAPSVSSDGSYILFTSNRTGKFHAWRMDIDGKNQKQLTNENGGWGPIASPTGNWFIYFSTVAAGGKENLWKMSLEGGESVQLTSLSSYNPAISPDGKMLAYSFWNETAKPERFDHEIISLENRRRIRSFELPSSAFRSSGNTLLRWMPDGSGLTFIDHRHGASNLSFVPLNGGQPIQLTNFSDSQIFWFDWSRDGRQIVMTRGVLLNDVVLIKNLQNLQHF